MPDPPVSKAAKAAAAAAAALLGTALLDRRYGFSTDLTRLLGDRAFMRRLQGRAAELGDSATPYRMLELAADGAPAAEALWFEGRTWSYAQLRDEVDRLAALLHGVHGLADGMTVAVYATNSPEMVFVVYALSKIGVVPALVNTALRNKTLAHCVRVADAKMAICTSDMAPPMVEMIRENEMAIPCLAINLLSFPPLALPGDASPGAVSQIRYEDLAGLPTPPAPIPTPKRTLKDVGLLLYTSGTTGSPKAVCIRTMLLMIVSTPTTIDANNPRRYLSPLRTYSCLPLFHGTAFFTGVMYGVGTRSTLCLARRFSASTFSRQLRACAATRMLYVGELCRYLLAAPAAPAHDRAHACSVAVGNGLHRDVWLAFRRRFGVAEVREMYRSTEGVARFDNVAPRGRAGAGKVGFLGPLGRALEQTTFLVRYDAGAEAPWRDPRTGFCVRVGRGEAGEAIGRVRAFDFYNDYLGDPEANEKKLIRDVFEKGDVYQRTGDLLMWQPDGWIRFHDRVGDTYRWRGENVSAGEVKDHIARLPNVGDAAVYGVKLEGYDGQAGAAGITLIDSSPKAEAEFVQALYPRLRKTGLTVYQMPRLVRITKKLDTGATFKHVKEVLKKRSWDPALGDQGDQGDQLYWLNGDKYEALGMMQWTEITAGRARL